WNEISVGELRLPIEKLVDRREAGNRHDVGQKSVTVRFGGGGKLRADGAGRSSLVFKDHRLLEHRFERGVERTCDRVAYASGWKRADHRDGPGRIHILGGRGAAHQRGGRCDRTHYKTAAIHFAPLRFCRPRHTDLLTPEPDRSN